MNRLLYIISLMILSVSSYALDTSDVGTYAVIHRDGHVTDFTFFVSLSGDRWNVEQKKPNGTWTNVTCERDCVLHESNNNEIVHFFSASALTEIKPSCVHNTAFAFCTYSLRAKPASKDYIFFALVQ